MECGGSPPLLRRVRVTYFPDERLLAANDRGGRLFQPDQGEISPLRTSARSASLRYLFFSVYCIPANTLFPSSNLPITYSFSAAEFQSG
jgi:hypothetical protein